MSRRGFTLIEIVIVTAIGVVLGALAFWGFSSGSAREDLDLVTASVVATLREASERARSQQGSSAWGVYFSNPASGEDYYALFSGSTYTAASSTHQLPRTLEWSNPASGASTEIVFNKLTGLPTTEKLVELRLKIDSTATKTIRVGVNGAISY